MTKKELYEDEYAPAGLRWMSLAVVFLAVSGFVALAWYAYNAGQQELRAEDVLIIEADDTPYRVEPSEPGGQDFKHKDKAIYDSLTAGKSSRDGKAEIVTAEAPKRPDLVSAAKTSDWYDDEPITPIKKAPDPKTITTYVSPIPKPGQKQVTPATPKVTVKKPVTPPESRIRTDAFAPVTKEEKRSSVVPKQPVVTGEKAHSVQLGAYRSNEEATEQWRQIQRSHLDILDRFSHRIIRADLGDKGVYYRLRVTGIASKEKSASICKTLSERNQPCFYSGVL